MRLPAKARQCFMQGLEREGAVIWQRDHNGPRHCAAGWAEHGVQQIDVRLRHLTP
jgi:hypothetical protein